MFRPKLDILSAAQCLIWEDLKQIPRSFVLYGGTAMALRLGHRQSVDFDFFSNERFELSNLLRNLAALRESRVDQRGDNTLSLVVDRSGPVRLSFFGEVGMNRIQDPDLAPGSRLQVASCKRITTASGLARAAKMEGSFAQFLALRMGPRLNKISSLATSVRSMTLAVAARNRLAGSRCDSGSCCAISTISWVKALPAEQCLTLRSGTSETGVLPNEGNKSFVMSV